MILRPTTEADISFIVGAEHSPELREYIGTWTSDEHRTAIHDSDVLHLIATDDSETALGYVIVRGLQSEHHNMELKRIVMTCPGRGHGREIMLLILKRVFEEFKAHRLWLDVFESNFRAQHLYRSLGFQQDGTFREAVYRDGKYHSLLLMSLLDREYWARHQR